MRIYSVAIDGPSGAGKSTISRAVAAELGFIYVDTGAIYRAVALGKLRTGALDLDQMNIVIGFDENGQQRVNLNGDDVTDAIRKHEVSALASELSALGEVRAFLLQKQRDLAANNSVIMDGRDIGTVVLPQADLKIFLTASSEDRAGRRHRELLSRGETVSYEQVLDGILTRDRNDSSRDLAPLRPAQDAVVLDTTGNTFEQSVGLIKDLIVRKLELCSTK